jgi:hypothetical protein
MKKFPVIFPVLREFATILPSRVGMAAFVHALGRGPDRRLLFAAVIRGFGGILQ